MPLARQPRPSSLGVGLSRSRRSSRAPQVNDTVEIWWSVDKVFYRGTLTRRHEENSFRVEYDDGEMEDLNLTNEYWRYAPDVQHAGPVREGVTTEGDVVEVVLDGSEGPPGLPKSAKAKGRKKSRVTFVATPAATAQEESSAVQAAGIVRQQEKTPRVRLDGDSASIQRTESRKVQEKKGTTVSKAISPAPKPAQKIALEGLADEGDKPPDPSLRCNASTSSNGAQSMSPGVQKEATQNQMKARSRASTEKGIAEQKSCPKETPLVAGKSPDMEAVGNAINRGDSMPGANPKAIVSNDAAGQVSSASVVRPAADDADTKHRLTSPKKSGKGDVSLRQLQQKSSPQTCRTGSDARDVGKVFGKKKSALPSGDEPVTRQSLGTSKSSSRGQQDLADESVKKIVHDRAIKLKSSQHADPARGSVKPLADAVSSKRECKERAGPPDQFETGRPETAPGGGVLTGTQTADGKPRSAADVLSAKRLDPMKPAPFVRKRKARKKISATTSPSAAVSQPRASKPTGSTKDMPNLSTELHPGTRGSNEPVARKGMKSDTAGFHHASEQTGEVKNGGSTIDNDAVDRLEEKQLASRQPASSVITATAPENPGRMGSVVSEATDKDRNTLAVESKGRSGLVSVRLHSSQKGANVMSHKATSDSAGKTVDVLDAGFRGDNEKAVAVSSRKRELADTTSAAVSTVGQTNGTDSENHAKRRKDHHSPSSAMPASKRAAEKGADAAGSVKGAGSPSAGHPQRPAPNRATVVQVHAANLEKRPKAGKGIANTVNARPPTGREQLSDLLGERIAPLRGKLQSVSADVQKMVSFTLSFRQEHKVLKDDVQRTLADEGREVRATLREMKTELLQAIQSAAADSERKLRTCVEEQAAEIERNVKEHVEFLLGRQREEAIARSVSQMPVGFNPNARTTRTELLRRDAESTAMPLHQEMSATGYEQSHLPPTGTLAVSDRRNAAFGVANGHLESPTTIANMDANPGMGETLAYNSVGPDDSKGNGASVGEETLRWKVTEVIARQVTVWLLETPHEYRRSGPSIATWARQSADRAFARVAELLARFSSYTQAYQTLRSSLGVDAVELQWFVQPDTQNLEQARRNYAAWDPPPSDEEWAAEMVLLQELSGRFSSIMDRYSLSGVSDMQGAVAIASAAAIDGQSPGQMSRIDQLGEVDRAQELSANMTFANGPSRNANLSTEMYR